jgi:hypothetical protein
VIPGGEVNTVIAESENVSAVGELHHFFRAGDRRARIFIDDVSVKR